MGVVIKYQGIKDTPVLLTPTGRYVAEPVTPPGELELRTARITTADQAAGGSIYDTVRAVEQERVLDELEARFANLAAAIDYLNVPEGGPSALSRTALSSAPSALTMAADPDAAAPANYTVDVQYTATGGVVLGRPVNPIATTTLAAGVHGFNLTIDGQTRQLNIEVDGETNEDLLRRLAIAINEVDPDVHAEVVYGFQDAQDPSPRTKPLNRTVRLRVSGPSDRQGPDFHFSEDASGLVDAYGLKALTPPRAAHAHVAGQTLTQADNVISLDGGHVVGQAVSDTDGPAQVDVRAGYQPVSEQLGKIIAQYNDLMSFMDLHRDVLRPSIKDRLTRPGEDRARVLPQIGLRFTAQGRLLTSLAFELSVRVDYPSVRELLVDQEDGWLGALRGKLSQLTAMDKSFWGEDLSSSSFGRAQRAWTMLLDVTQSIVGGYY